MPAWRKISLPISSFGRQNLPAVCVTTGQPTEEWTTVRLLWFPRWASILYLLGPIGMLFQMMMGRSLPVEFPVHDSLIRAQRQKQVTGVAFAFFGAFLVAVSAVLPDMADSLRTGVIASFVFAALLLWFARRPFIPVKLLASPTMELSGVRLRYVHPEFTAAVERSNDDITVEEQFFGKEIAEAFSVFDQPNKNLALAGAGDPWK